VNARRHLRRWAPLLCAACLMRPAVFAETPSEPAGAGAAARTVNFSFDQADIRLLARMVGEITGRRIVVGEKVEGRITILAPGPVAAQEVYPLFVAVLESRGWTIMERDGTAFIVPLPEGPAGASAPLGAPGVAGWQTRIFKLEHADAVEFARAIEPLVRAARAGGVSVFAASNQVMVTDTEGNLDRLDLIRAEVDQPGAARSIEVVPLQHASAEDLASEVSLALSASERAGAQVSRHLRQVAEGGAAQPAGALLVASPHSNSLVLVGTTVQRQEMRRIIELLDVEGIGGQGRLHAIFLRFLPAEEAAKSLSALMEKAAGKEQRQRISIEPSLSNNALLVEASPRDVQWVRELVDQLDQMPQQVMVEVLIAEVALNKNLDLGVEWATVETPDPGETGVVGRSRPGATDAILDAVTKSVFPQGLAVGVARGSSDGGAPRVAFLLQALQDNRDVKILSSVPLWAQNNAEASVSVVENIPVLRSTIEGGSGTARDVIQNIDRMDVGIKLKITPHINPHGDVTLNLNPSIEAIVDEGPSGTAFAPTIARREVKTTVTVPDRSTVVISGLIREDRVRRVSKVPLLGDIPWLGALFRYTSERNQRTNLLVFVTPRIIRSAEDRAGVRTELEQRAPDVAEASASALTPPAEEPDHAAGGGP
jgi:general secretion pathway protein D